MEMQQARCCLESLVLSCVIIEMMRPPPLNVDRTEKKTSCWISAYKRLLTERNVWVASSQELREIFYYTQSFLLQPKDIWLEFFKHVPATEAAVRLIVKLGATWILIQATFDFFSFSTFSLNPVYHCDNCNKPHTVYKCPVSPEVRSFGTSLTYCILGEVPGFEWHCPTILLSFILPPNL